MALCLFVAVLGAIGVVSPGALLSIAQHFQTPSGLYAAAALRIILGGARIPYEVPSQANLPDRLDSVLRVIYLVLNEGYSASSGASLTRHDLSAEAVRLGRLLIELLPELEAMGLLALRTMV